MTVLGFRLPEQVSYENTLKFLVHDAFPAVLETNIIYNETLPEIGIYRQVQPGIRPFMDAVNNTTGRQHTISGVGSLIDYERFGHEIKRPSSPFLSAGGCGGTSLCLEPTCFGFTEGFIENNNTLRDFCWELSMPCLKDHFYTDRKFPQKMASYFSMFFKQGPAVLQAYQRTRLIRDAIKVVAVDGNIRYTGSVIGGSEGISLPFFIHPTNPTGMPKIDELAYPVGGLNIAAFSNFLHDRLFAKGGFDAGVESVTVYGMRRDLNVAKEQTAQVQDGWAVNQLSSAMSMGKIEDMLGDFVHDGLFPTFKEGEDGYLELIPFDILEPSTIAGFVQTANPEHGLAPYRALLLVPRSYKMVLVEPPRDDFSDLGLGESLNFRTNTPGVQPIMSSSMFTRGTRNGSSIIIGEAPGANGVNARVARGLVPRGQAIQEAIRTEVMLTYASANCEPADGQLPNVARNAVAQKRADGFALKSTMYVGDDIVGTALPVLIIFRTDTPRSARPISVCKVTDIDVSVSSGNTITNACPGNAIYNVLTFRHPVGDAFAVNDVAVYRSGPKGQSVLVDVTAKAGNVLTIEAVDNTTILPVCPGSGDDYGVLADLVKVTGTTLLSSEIMKAECDPDTGDLFIETFLPLTSSLAGADATITLENGETILVDIVGATAAGVFFRLATRAGETCDFCELLANDCSCLVNATFTKLV